MAVGGGEDKGEPLYRERDKQLLAERLQFAESLLGKAHLFSLQNSIFGIQKIKKHIKAEMTMLKKLISGEVEIKKHHVTSTNLLHLEGVLHVCDHAPTVVAVERFFKYNDSGQEVDLMVDVVINGGGGWVKLFARKRRALHKKWLGEGSFGEKTVTDFAEDYLKARTENLYNFSPPSVTFVFFDGITKSIADELHGMGIMVVGPVYPDDDDGEAPSPLQIVAMFKRAESRSLSVAPVPIELPPEPSVQCRYINFDVSSMIAWVSSLVHTPPHTHHFSDKVLSEQSRQEALEPVWPILQRAVQGKHLIACQTAVDSFNSIVSVIGGPHEQERARELLQRLDVVDDCVSEKASKLQCSGRIKQRAKVIFGTGDHNKAVTLTANEGFVRAAAGRGVLFNTIVHACRALSEAQEQPVQPTPASATADDNSTASTGTIAACRRKHSQ